MPVGIGGGVKAIGIHHPSGGELHLHFSQGRTLSLYRRDIAYANLIDPQRIVYTFWRFLTVVTP